MQRLRRSKIILSPCRNKRPTTDREIFYVLNFEGTFKHPFTNPNAKLI